MKNFIDTHFEEGTPRIQVVDFNTLKYYTEFLTGDEYTLLIMQCIFVAVCRKLLMGPS